MKDDAETATELVARMGGSVLSGDVANRAYFKMRMLRALRYAQLRSLSHE